MTVLRPDRRLTILLAAAASFLAGPAGASDFAPEPAEWRPWPEDYPQFQYSREELTERWDELHRRDRAPFPDADYVRELSAEPPADPEATARRLLDGWRDFHAGNFEAAFRAGFDAGPPGDFLAGRAWLIYATHMTRSEDRRRKMLKALVGFIEANLDDRDPPPTYWETAGLALIYAEYGRTLSTNRARAEDIPETVRDLVVKALEKEPAQPAALGTLGGWHAEIIDRVGGLLARMLFGAKKSEAHEYFNRALTIAPDLVQLRREYGEAILRLYGSDREDDALEQLRTATEITPLNAEDYLEQRRAEEVIETWHDDRELP